MAHRKGRSILTGTGIVLGVAIFFGVIVSNATTQRGVDDLLDDFTGRSDVIVNATGAFDAKIPETIETKLRKTDGVVEAVGGFGYGADLVSSTQPPDDGEGFGNDGTFVSGIKLEQERKFQNFDLIAGRFFKPQTTEAIVPNEFATLEGWEPGAKVALKTPKGQKTLTIVGILDDTGAGRQGNVFFTPLETARKQAGEGKVYNGIGVILGDGIETDAWITAHEDDFASVRFRNSETLAQGFKSFLQVFGTMLMFFSVITLFISAFLIYLTLSMAVIERTRMYGTLRALGSTRKQVRRVVIGEALALGAVSTVAGLLLGLGLAKGLLALISNLFDLDIPGLAIAPSAVIAAVIIGMLTTLLSSLVPAVRAGRLAPVEAMRGDYAGEAKLGRGWMVGLAVFVVSIALAVAGNQQGEETSPLPALGVLGILLGSILLVPLLLRPLASVLGKITNRIARGVGDIAVLHLAKERSRSAYTLALIMIVMAMLFGSGGLYLSTAGAIDELIDRQFGSDLFIEGNGPIEPEAEQAIRNIDGVASVSPIRFGFSKMTVPKDTAAKPTAGKPVVTDTEEDVFMFMVDPKTYFDHSSFFWKDGSDSQAKEMLTKGGYV
ncbi:MAG: FtsX-like permease family protein, partial [Actinomycetota bacterium]